MDIHIAVKLPPGVEERLRAESGDLSATAREAFAIELFRRGFLSHDDLGQSLGLDRFETDSLLKRYRVTGHALTYEELDSEIKRLNQRLAPPR
jgi:predicted HTH domain antitoxin